MIFETFEALDAGAGFELVNDHDPKPLYYQLAAERPGEFTWKDIEAGPEVWLVRIWRSAARAAGRGCGSPIDDDTIGLQARAARGRRGRPAGLERVADASSLEPLLRELVKVGASQINGCAHCLDMHTKDAVAIGETEQRLHLFVARREAPLFTSRERAALAWTEALTRLPETGAPDDAYDAAMAAEFSSAEQVVLTLAIVAINGWNRLAVGFRSPVGGYDSHNRP